jgi:predicted phage terminase large subunit-like protein
MAIPPLPDRASSTLEAASGAGSLENFARAAWPLVEPGRPLVWGRHLSVICEHLEAVWPTRQLRNLLVTIPPRHTKSTLVSVLWPAWIWTREPDTRLLTASYAGPLALRDAVRSRRIIESGWYQEAWPDVELRRDQNTKGRYDNLAGGYRLATSVGGGATGEGGDVLIVDDPHDIDEQWSPQMLERAWAWWSQVMSQRVNDPKRAGRVIIQQRIHEHDLAGRLLAEGGWDHLSLPTIAEPPTLRPPATALGWTDKRPEGALLWPKRFPPDAIRQAQADLGPVGFAGQHQQRPAPRTGVIFDPLAWGTWTALPDPSTWDAAVCSWDLAFGDAEGSSYNVGLAMAVVGVHRYILEVVRERERFSDVLPLVTGLADRWPRCTPVLVEKRANGPALLSMLEGSVDALEAVEPRGSKEQRAWAAQPVQAAGHVLLPAEAPWREAFEDELKRFPRAGYDDQVDAYSQAINWLAMRPKRPASAARLAAVIHRRLPRRVGPLTGGRW